MSLSELKAKIEAQKAGRQPGMSPLSTEGIEPHRKHTPAHVIRPVATQPVQETAMATPEAPTVQAEPPKAQAPQTSAQPPRRRPPAHLQKEHRAQAVKSTFDAMYKAEPHVLITMQDCDCEPGAYCPVCDGGLSVCRVCGNAEAELDQPCKPNGKEPLPKPTQAQTEALLKGGRNVLATPLPDGYMALGKHDTEALMWCKAEVIKAQIMAFDYETNGDPDDDTTDPQDHRLVGVSFTWKIGFAVYLPIAHDNYGANWDLEELKSLFLKPLLEDPEILLIAHNVKVEYQWSLLIDIDFFHKAQLRKVVDTMLMVKLLALPENTEWTAEEGWAVRVGLKPVTKALLASEDGMVHGLLHVDDIKSFTDTVGKHIWYEQTGEFYKTSTKTAKKGDPKLIMHQRSRTFNELPVDKATVDYGASDSDWALGAYFKLLPIAEATGVMDVMFELDIPRMMVLAEYELAGWHVSREKLWALEKVAHKALHGDPDAAEEAGQRGLESLLNDELIELVPNAQIQWNEATGREEIIVPAGRYHMGIGRPNTERRKIDVYLEIKKEKVFNWGSNQHKPWLFYHILKFPMDGVERSKATGLPKCDGKTIDRFIEDYTGESKFMQLLKEKSKYDKILSTYVEGMLPFCRTDTDRLHTNLSLVSTWRLSSKKPNLQNLPRPENDPMRTRGVFVAPFLPPEGKIILPEKRILLPDKSPSTSEGRIITPADLNAWTAKTWNFIIKHKLSGHTFYIGSDYAQIELKVLAWYAGEASMIWALANGVDIHSKTAKDVFKLDCTVEQVKELYKPFRYRAKTVNFGLVYGMTEYGLAKDPKMGMTVEQAKRFIEDYMNTYPGVRAYADSMIAFGRTNGYVETMFNHRRPVPHVNDPNPWIRQKAENICMNTPIQGSAADIIALAMVNIRREQYKAPYLSMHMQIHDELQGQAPVEHTVESAWFMQEVMERPIDGFSEIMPIVSEPAVGPTWELALDLKKKPDGTPYVKPKKEAKEASDVTYEMIEPYMHMYKLAGIEVA